MTPNSVNQVGHLNVNRMADRDRSDEQPSSRPTHPPPPCDPFARYQTPWPRNYKGEQNPFVQFRRFADEQFQAIFSGVPKIFTAFSAGANAGADAFQREIEQVMQQRHEFEEGFRKQFEQDIEEQRQALTKLRHRREQHLQQQALEQQGSKPETSKSPWWQSGRAANCPALNEMQSENARSCPAMYDQDGKPKTELDAYETMQAAQTYNDLERDPQSGRRRDYQMESMLLEQANKQRVIDEGLLDKEGKLTERDNPSKDPSQSNKWLSGVGFDGKQREQTLTPSTSPKSPSKTDSPITTISRFASRWSRPFDNPHDTIPWLLVNQYSPVFLCNPNQPRVGRVKLQQGVNQPFRIVDAFYIPRGFFQFNDRREELAKQLPWADAFEDLVSLQQTGVMVDRDYSTYRTPKTWIHDMVQRGSLGPTWGFNEQGQLTKMARESRDQKVETVAARQDDMNPGFFSNLPAPDDVIATSVVATALDAQHQQQVVQELVQEYDKLTQKSPSETSPPSEEQSDIASSTPSDSAWSSTTWSSTANSHQHSSDTIISSTTTTERWTKPDGTIETRRVFKRRFSDGREVEEETHDFEEPARSEHRHATSLEQAPWPVGPKETTQELTLRDRSSEKQTQTATPVQDELRDRRRGGGGWFWN